MFGESAHGLNFTFKLGQINRGDSTPIELFVQGIRSWGPETRVLLAVKP